MHSGVLLQAKQHRLSQQAQNNRSWTLLCLFKKQVKLFLTGNKTGSWAIKQDPWPHCEALDASIAFPRTGLEVWLSLTLVLRRLLCLLGILRLILTNTRPATHKAPPKPPRNCLWQTPNAWEGSTKWRQGIPVSAKINPHKQPMSIFAFLYARLHSTVIKLTTEWIAVV